ncbi:MAG TPA: muconolactone Delta-isomerase family protein [Candidatus Micrarchaeaceae archaeon]|nr:muconolactone Delta-isomerase family protein [Candidatus Micrarchaeaceae archaeon]
MLFLVDTDIDFNALGQQRDEVLTAEWAHVEQQWQNGTMLRIWRKANGLGIIGVWDVADADALRAEITSLPIFRYLSDIRVTPLVQHPKYPHHARPESGQVTEFKTNGNTVAPA